METPIFSDLSSMGWLRALAWIVASLSFTVLAGVIVHIATTGAKRVIAAVVLAVVYAGSVLAIVHLEGRSREVRLMDYYQARALLEGDWANAEQGCAFPIEYLVRENMSLSVLPKNRFPYIYEITVLDEHSVYAFNPRLDAQVLFTKSDKGLTRRPIAGGATTLIPCP